LDSNFVIAVKECVKAVRLIETKLGGKADTLFPGSMASLKKKKKKYTTTVVSHGGHNISHGKFARFKNKWYSFEKKFSEFHNQTAIVAQTFEKMTFLLQCSSQHTCFCQVFHNCTYRF